MKNIVFWDIATYNWLWLPLAKRFKDMNRRCKIYFICSTKQRVNFRQAEDEDGIINRFLTTNHFFREYDNAHGSCEEIISKARAYEKKYNMLISDALQADRHLGVGFFPGGIKHPKSQLSEKADYIKSVVIFNKIVEFWEKYLDETRPDLIIGATAGIIGKICSVVAKKRNIPIRALVSARYQSYFYWATNEFYSVPDIQRRFETMTSYENIISPDELSGLKRLPWSDKNYKKYIKYKSGFFLVSQIFKHVKRHISKRMKRVITMGNYIFSEDIKYSWRIHTAMKTVDSLKTVNSEDLTGLSFVVYPLHTEPEAAMGMLSPEFNEQLAIIELLAKNLPAGTFLAVKEHLGALGRRPSDFYFTLKKIPNVVLLHPCDYLLEFAKKSRAVAVITSTIGTEAAILGIPVISFGLHNNFNFLPHVHYVKSWIELRPLLHKLCVSEDSNEEKKIRCENGKRYLAALKSVSVDLSWSNYSACKRMPATQKEVDVLYSSLVKSLGFDE